MLPNLVHLSGHWTSFESYNALRRLFEDWQAGESHPAELLAALETFATEMARTDEVFRSELRFREPSPELSAASPVALEALSGLPGLVDELRDSLREGQSSDVRRLLDRLQRRLTRLGEAFAALRALEEADPSLSPSPIVDSLLKAGRLYHKGGLPGPLLLEKVEAVSAHLASVQQLLDQPSADAREMGFLDQHREEWREEFRAAREALAELALHLREPVEEDDERLVAELLDEVRATTLALYLGMQKLQSHVAKQPRSSGGTDLGTLLEWLDKERWAELEGELPVQARRAREQAEQIKRFPSLSGQERFLDLRKQLVAALVDYADTAERVLAERQGRAGKVALAASGERLQEIQTVMQEWLAECTP